ncbi:hypothetical protein KQX54_020927 [Cotesia glomerata]|uniref:Uncharacterized protein n=1 Tax=Cotesia glomerata TaxID=32391 RepID=A0AAV7I3N8_COTGL|nr:hypothetical protein KQX54_020927 [Cotesia glomerata]
MDLDKSWVGYPGPGLGVVLMSRCRPECKVLSVVCRVGWTLNCCSGLHQYIIHFLTTTCNLMSSIKAKAPYRGYRVPERRVMPKVIYTYKIREGVGVVGLSLLYSSCLYPGFGIPKTSKPATYVPPTLPRTEDRGDSRFRGDRVPWNPIYRVTASSLLLLLISYFLLFYPTRLRFLLSLLPTSLLAAMSYLVLGEKTSLILVKVQFKDDNLNF